MVPINSNETANKCMLTRDHISRLPDNINFAEEECVVLSYWQNERIFEKCMELSKGKPKYTFYDGPPFATGLPHYGHILAGTIKDIVTRYAYQQGYYVDRRFGWDCHGLPVEFEIDKMLNIRGPDDIQAMGIANYNAECRKIVMRYALEWETIVTRMGRWVDFRNDYKTLYPWYMESIWWVFKQLYDKGFVYQGVKVMPYSTACNTPLSNFESGQNYKEVVDPCVVVALQLLNETNTYILVWTTTPWTLPSNYACCVNAQISYVKVENLSDQRLFILAESRLGYVFKTQDEYRIINKFVGKDLANLSYKPLFPYFTSRGLGVNAFRVLVDDYVTEDSGTGIVHNAPYFGEDDYRVCLQAELISKSSSIICPVDESGRFTAEVTDFAGLYVKDADKKIIAHLKQTGNLVSVGQVKHMYPYCWRSDTPLIYKAVPSWFICVEHMSKQLLACSAKTYWVPDFVKEKRFGNWLKDARDWAVSRNRYWGTPIPIWTNGDEFVCIGSIKQLENLSGQTIVDLHRESIDHIEIPSGKINGEPLRRIKPVFDCWFESGSMPFAQQHYPFENERDFMHNFPADFIAEGIDQTRGWFYTLLVISTALFNQAPYKNLIANGLILAADGQKMSKRKKNYPDPMEIVHKYGADALRLYLINSPVVRAENLRFKEEGVRDVIKDVLLPWYNSFRFLLQNIARYEKEELMHEQVYVYDPTRHTKEMQTLSVMDVWIISFKESLLEFLAKEMKLYHLYTVVPRLTKFIDQLTNWYIRLNRLRLKGEFGKENCIQSIDCLYNVLFNIVIMMAPFTPFIAEHIYQRLVLFQKDYSSDKSSVHFQMMPKFDSRLIRPDVEKCVSLMQSVIELGRIIRDRRTWPIKYPVREIIVIHKDEDALNQIKSMESFILSELNSRKMTLSNDRVKYGITVRAEPDHKILGQRLKSTFKSVMLGLKALSNDQVLEYVAQGFFEICGERIEMDEVRILYGVAETIGEHFEAHSDNEVLVLMDMQQDMQLWDEGLAREVINRIQKLKKKADLIPTDPVTIYYEIMGSPDITLQEQITRVLNVHNDMIVNTVKSKLRKMTEKNPEEDYEIITENVQIKQFSIQLSICSKQPLQKKLQNENTLNKEWINIILGEDIESRFGNSRKASLFLEDMHTKKKITFNELQREIKNLFGLYGLQFNIMVYNIKTNTWSNLKEPIICKNALLCVTRKSNIENIESLACQVKQPFCSIRQTKGNEYCFLENPFGVNLL